MSQRQEVVTVAQATMCSEVDDTRRQLATSQGQGHRFAYLRRGRLLPLLKLFVMLQLHGSAMPNSRMTMWSSSATSWQGGSPCECWAPRLRPAPALLFWSGGCALHRAGAHSWCSRRKGQ
eukprot:1527412-Pyramimonas_sp.AAC.1